MPWKRLTPAEVADRLAERTGIPIEQIKKVLRAQAQLAYAEATNGFTIPGIGMLVKKVRPERRGRYPSGPKAGQEIIIRAKEMTKFRVSRLVKSMGVDGSQELPDIFRAPEIPEFTFSGQATELPENAALVAEFAGPHFTPVGESAQIRFLRLPDLHLPTGRICVADPMLFGGAPPLVRSVAPGRYPFILGVAHINRSERIALAIARFSDERPVRWETAIAVGGGESYGVDSGCGCMCDEAVFLALAAAEEADDEFFERLTTEMQESWVHADCGKGSLIAFSSGYGDGAYKSYFGLTEDARAVALVTDFGVVKFPAQF
jgi:nucleoid DNA-binding protein